MTSVRWPRLLVALLALAVAAASSVSSAHGSSADDERRPPIDLKVARHGADGCGELGDTLPVLVTETGLQPGDSTPTVIVCAVNRGASPARLTLGVLERAETDVSCSGDEAIVDPTCGGGLEGELGASLLVHVATQLACRGPSRPVTVTPFGDLAAAAAPILADMRKNQLHCISLRLEHRPASEEAAAAAQTDSVGWRYAFDLST